MGNLSFYAQCINGEVWQGPKKHIMTWTTCMFGHKTIQVKYLPSPPLYWYALHASRMLTDCVEDPSIAICEKVKRLLLILISHFMVNHCWPWLPVDFLVQWSFELLQDSLLWELPPIVIQQLFYYFNPSSERNKMEMTDTLNWPCHAHMSRKITLPIKLTMSLNSCTDEYKLAIIFPWKEPKSWNKVIEDISNKYNTGYFSKNKLTVVDNGWQKCWDTLSYWST